MVQEKHKRATNWRLVGRVLFYIACFNMVIRSDMWVSICIVMVVCIQLAPLLWVKKIRAKLSEENRQVFAQKVKGVIQRWHAASVNAKAAENTPSSCVNIMVDLLTGHHQEDQHCPCADKEAVPNDICDDARFEDVWRDCDTK